jgi:hypothetical protein
MERIMRHSKCIQMVFAAAFLLGCMESAVIKPPAGKPFAGSLAFSPSGAGAGASVIIRGNNFSAAPAGNIVFFGAVRASVVTASTTRLQVTVPASATYAPITVTVNGLTASSRQPFMPTFVGDGKGIRPTSFVRAATLPTGAYPVRVVVADLDGDGKPDLIVGNINDHTIGIYRNISTAGSLSSDSFAPPVLLDVPDGTSSPFNLVAADLDGDGKLDIIAADAGNNLVSVFHNNCVPGHITADSFGARVDFVTGATPMDVEVADMDGDGKPDLVTANATDGTVSILRNTSVVGSLTAASFAPKIDIATGSGCFTVAVGDLDGDGRPDLATANSRESSVSVLRNLSSPGRIAFAPKASLSTLQAPFHVAIGDLDGDGKPDLLVACYYANSLSVFRNLSTVGSLTAGSFASRIDYPLSGRGHRAAVGDLDGDGKPDIAVVTELSPALSIFRNVSAPGSFTGDSLADRVDFATGPNPASVAICDLDGDGRPDIVFCNEYNATITIYRNKVPFGNGAPAR